MRERAVKAVISDLDGTLVDTRSANIAAYRDAFATVGVPFVEVLYQQAFGLAFDAMMDVVAPEVGKAERAAIGRRKAEVYSSYLPLNRPNASLLALLGHLRQGGTRIALATTARRSNVLAVLQHCAADSLFDALVTAEDVARGKPAPDCYLAAAARLGVEPDECVVFEDSEVGVEAANRAGCRVIEVRL
jgi:beta-phosphoglucomutase